MNRKFGILLLALILAMALVAFTACGNDDNGGAAADDGVIRMDIQLLGLTDAQMDVYRERGDLYETSGPAFDLAVRRAIEAMPGVEVNFVDWGWAETLDTAQRTRIAAGDPPHIVGGEVFMPTYAMEGILYPLPQDIVNSVVPSALLHDPQGVPVAVIGGGGSVFMLFYNRDILEAAGFDRAPETWDEWRYMSRVITENVPGAWGGGVPSFPHAGGALRATPFFRQLGVDFFQGGQVMLGDPRLHEALEFIRYMNQFLPPGLGNAADEGPLWNAFEEDQVIAFVVNGTWQVGGAERNNMNWGVAPLPMPAGGQYGNCLVGVTFFGVPRGAPHPDISFDLIRVTLREDVSSQSFHNFRASPTRALHAQRHLFEHSEALTVAMDALYEGGFSGLVAFPSNSGEIWEIINMQVLARTTMTNDPIANITADALVPINMHLGN